MSSLFISKGCSCLFRTFSNNSEGQQLGVLKVGLDQQSVLDIPLVALDTVQQAWILGKAWDAIRLWIK